MELTRVKVDCSGCRACCYFDTPLTPADNPNDYLTDAHTAPNGTTNHLLKRLPNGACVYLGEQGCTIYDRAPTVCRMFTCASFPSIRRFP